MSDISQARKAAFAQAREVADRRWEEQGGLDSCLGVFLQTYERTMKEHGWHWTPRRQTTRKLEVVK